jgi:sugar phosphate isomerase/epimerase
MPGDTLAEKLSNLERYGFEGIEFWGTDLKSRAAEIKKLTRVSSVKPSTVCDGYRGWLIDPAEEKRAQAREDIKLLLEGTADIGAIGLIVVPVFGISRIFPGPGTGRSDEEDYCVLREALAELSEHARKVGALLLLEPLNRYVTPIVHRLDEAVALCREINNPSLKIMADFYHMNIEEMDIADSIRQAGGFLAHVHLADNTRLLPGYGHIDFKAGFQALREIGYDGYMALECGIPGDPEAELPRCVQFLRREWRETLFQTF